MQVTLKKGAALAAALAKADDGVRLEQEVSIYSDTPFAELIANARDTQLEAVGNMLARTAAVYQLRALLGAANTAVGVDQLLNQRAEAKAKLEQLKALTPASKAPESDALDRKRLAKRENSERLYGEDELAFKVLTTEDVEAHAAPLRKQLVELEDQLQALNFSNKIELPEDLVATLRAYDLV